jgi:group I intron endonuclease
MRDHTYTYEGRSTQVIDYAILKYGVDNFLFYVVEYCEVDQLYDRERYYIKQWRTLASENGYNILEGGSGNQRNPKSPELIQKMRMIFSGSCNPNYGKTFSEERKKQMSLAQTGKKASKETK